MKLTAWTNSQPPLNRHRRKEGEERCQKARSSHTLIRNESTGTNWPSCQPRPATETHKPIPHIEVVNAIIETLGFRHIAVHRDEYAVSEDGNKMFGLMELDQTFTGCRFALGLRNSHDKTMRLALTVGYRVFVCDNMAFNGDFTPLLAKHTKNFQLTRALAGGIDDMQRNFDPDGEGAWNYGGRAKSQTWRRSSSSTGRSLKRKPMSRATSTGRSTSSTSIRCMRNSSLVRCGALKRIHVSVQGTRPDTAVQGNGEARRIPPAGRSWRGITAVGNWRCLQVHWSPFFKT